MQTCWNINLHNLTSKSSCKMSSTAAFKLEETPGDFLLQETKHNGKFTLESVEGSKWTHLQFGIARLMRQLDLYHYNWTSTAHPSILTDGQTE